MEGNSVEFEKLQQIIADVLSVDVDEIKPDNIKKMKNWNKAFTAPSTADELESLRQL